jgi:hypothetical protein
MFFYYCEVLRPFAGEVLLVGESLNTIDLLLLTSLENLFLILQTLLIFYKTSYLNGEVNRTELSLSVRVPCYPLSH